MQRHVTPLLIIFALLLAPRLGEARAPHSQEAAWPTAAAIVRAVGGAKSHVGTRAVIAALAKAWHAAGDAIEANIKVDTAKKDWGPSESWSVHGLRVNGQTLFVIDIGAGNGNSKDADGNVNVVEGDSYGYALRLVHGRLIARALNEGQSGIECADLQKVLRLPSRALAKRLAPACLCDGGMPCREP